LHVLGQPLLMVHFEAKSPIFHWICMVDMFLFSMTSNYTRKDTQPSVYYEVSRESKQWEMIMNHDQYTQVV
jgi:Ni,Fe-hydrogenase I cytochrome b subunit